MSIILFIEYSNWTSIWEKYSFARFKILSSVVRKYSHFVGNYLRKKCFVFLTLFAFVSSSAVADDLLRINADIRYRWKYENNFNQKFYGKNFPKGDSDDGFLLQRIRLTFDFNPHRNVHIFGARNRMYGRINLMDWGNLQDAQINLEFKPVKKMADDAEANWCFLQLHYRFSEVFHERSYHKGL